MKGSFPGCLQARLLPFPWVSTQMSPPRRVLPIPPGSGLELCSAQPRLLSHNLGRLRTNLILAFRLLRPLRFALRLHPRCLVHSQCLIDVYLLSECPGDALASRMFLGNFLPHAGSPRQCNPGAWAAWSPRWKVLGFQAPGIQGWSGLWGDALA